MLKRFLFLFISTLLFSIDGVAQKSWTLDNCIAYALEHNLGQEAQNYNSKINKEKWQQSKRDLLPTIQVSYPSYNVSFGRTLDRVTNSFTNTRFVSGLSGGLSSSLTLFESFKKWHTLAYQKLIYESSKFDSQEAQYNLAFKIMELFNSVLFQEGALAIVKEQQTANLLRQKVIVKKVALGLVAKSDLYEIEAVTSSDALEVLRAENSLREVKLSLIQEMNLEALDITIVQGIVMKMPISTNELSNIENMFGTSQTSLPSLQKHKLSVEMAKKELAIKKTALLPSIRLGASISTGFSDNFKDSSGNTVPFSEQIKNNQSKFFGLSLNYPIFGNGRTRSAIKIAKITLEKAKTQLKIEQQRVYKIIQELLQKNNALISEKQLNIKEIKAKKVAYTFAKKKFEKNLINLYDLQIASTNYLKTKIEQIRLKTQIAIQKRTLDFYNGTFVLPTLSTSN